MKYLSKFLLSFLLLALISTQAIADNDWENWTEIPVSYKINDQWKFKLGNKFVFIDDMSNFDYWEIVPGLAYKANDHLELAGYYFYSREDKGAFWQTENRLRADATYKWDWKDFTFSDRNRYEWRFFDDKPKSRYRNRVMISKNIEIFDQKITPYIANEFFFDFKAVDEYNQNRALVGFKKKLNENLSMDIYYMLKSSRSGNDWNETNILGTKLAINF